MPKAGGLPDVTQRFDADSSGYTRAADEVVIAAIKMAKENRTAIDDMIASQREMMKINIDLRNDMSSMVMANREGSASVIEHTEAVKDAVHMYANLQNASRDQAIMVRELGRTHDDTTTSIASGSRALDDYRKKLEAVRKEADDAATSIAAIHKGTSDYLAAATRGKNRDGAGIIDAAIASAAGGGGGGGGGGAAAIMAARMAAGGGGDGGINPRTIFGTGSPSGGGGGSFVPWRGGGWNAVRFWGMMTAEVAATVVPALTAAGAAALVGVQSIEAMVPRYKAIFTTSEALGDAFNMTTGKFLGGGTALQTAQDRAQGAGYDIAGSLLGILQSGGGQGFIDMGTNTLSMLDRGFAQMAINFTKGGTGKRLSDALGGGPEYLRQFGDIGANIGNTLLNVAPNLPGVGQDLLSTVQGGTGLLARITRDTPGPVIGALLSYEAASRWGPALLGGEGLIGRMLGLKGVGGLGGLISKGGIALGGMGASGGMLEGLGLGISGAGEALAGIAGWPAGLLGGTAYLMSAGLTAKNLPQQRLGWLQDSINQAGFSDAWQPLAHAVTTASGLAATSGRYVGKAGALGLPVNVSPDPRAAQRLATLPTYDANQYRAGMQGFATQMGNLANSAPELMAALKKAGLKSVSLADAFQIGQNAMLDMSHAFGKNGKLTAAAQEMVTSYARVIAPMTQSSGAFGAAVAGQTIMSQGAMQNLAKVNQAMDSYQQIIAGGPTGAGLAAAAGAAPAAAIAKALTSYTTPGGAAAWQAFASTSSSKPGFITQMQGFNDQMRTYLTLGTAGLPQAQEMSAFQLKSILPQARQSKSALAMLMQQGAQMGVTGYYDTSKSLAQNFKSAEQSITRMAGSSKTFNKNMTDTVVASANLPEVAKQFADYTGAQVGAHRLAKVYQDAMAIQKTATAGASGKFGGGTFGGPMINQSAVQDMVSQLRAAGVQGGAAMKASLDAVLRQAGVSKAVRLKIEAQVTGDGKVKTLQQLVNSLHGKNVNVAAYANSHPVQTLQAAIAGLTGKTVTVTTNVVTNYINTVHTQLGVPKSVAAGVSPGYLLSHGHYGGLVTTKGIGMQTGGMVPGTGLGDIIPAMLEPGEAIIPRYLVPLIAPILAAHKVPGFGGVPQSSASHFAAGGVVPHAKSSGGIPASDLAKIAKEFAFTLSGAIAKEIKNSASAKEIATSLVKKISQEVGLARNVASAAMKGQGFGDSGIFGNMNVTPGSGGGTVYEQMQSYLGSVQSFTKDIATLRKGKLNKNIISQLIAAGPVQGDALAQSIMNDYGGIKGVNSLWSQLGGATKGLGAQAAMAQYGGMLAPNLRSGTFVGQGGTSININVNAGQSGTLNLTEAQIKALVAKIQAALLKQAKRNNKTGIQLSGKGA